MATLFDLIDIELLANVAETRSFTQGAVLSHMCLSAASKRIKHVEERLGTRVFYRDTEGIVLTQAGKALYDGGRRILHQVNHLVDDLHEYAQGVKGQIRITAPTTVSTEYLPAPLCRYLESHRDVSIDLRMRSSRDVVRAVGEELADIGIIARDVRTDGLDLLPYRHERWAVVTGLRHPLAMRTTIGFEETLDFEYIGLPETSTTQELLNEAANASNRTLKIRVQAANLAVLCRMAEANAGIGILPESIARQNAKSGTIRTIPLTDTWARYVMQICVRNAQELPPYIRKLVELLVADGDAGATNAAENNHRKSKQTRVHQLRAAMRSR
jgi:DNA-binding transcriptional LysR family regulator